VRHTAAAETRYDDGRSPGRRSQRPGRSAYAAEFMDAERPNVAEGSDRGPEIGPDLLALYRCSVAEIMAADDVVGADYLHAGRSPGLSWKLWIGSAGTLSVIVQDCTPAGPVGYRLLRRDIGRDEVPRVVRQAERVGFDGFDGRYQTPIDLGTCRVCVRLSGRLKCVESYPRNPPGLWPLWRRIHRHAPRVNRNLPWWARGWRGRLFDRGV
jgi:hypothetical protein